MAEKASIRLRVSDVQTALDFYTQTLGFTLDFDKTAEGLAQVSFLGRGILLAREMADVSPLLVEHYDAPTPGKRLYLGGGTLSYKEELESRNAPGLTWTEAEWGSTTLQVTDPDGHYVSFWGGRALSDEELLDWYLKAPERLEEAVMGLADDQLDLARAPGKWTIRQIVLHVVDSDATSLARMKFALAEPGRVVYSNPYNPDVWAESLDYAHRPIVAEIALFRGIRGHISGLLNHIPGAMKRTTASPEGHSIPVRPSIEGLTVHALNHIEQIWETRRAHGV